METKRDFFFKEKLNGNKYLECGKQFYRRVRFCVPVRIRKKERPYKCDIIIIIIIIIMDLFITTRLAVHHYSHAEKMPCSFQIRDKEFIKVQIWQNTGASHSRRIVSL